MKKALFVACAAVAMTIGVVNYGSQMAEVRDNNKVNACDSGCIEGRDRCVSECQSRTASGENPDNASCQLACDEAKSKCTNECSD